VLSGTALILSLGKGQGYPLTTEPQTAAWRSKMGVIFAVFHGHRIVEYQRLTKATNAGDAVLNPFV